MSDNKNSDHKKILDIFSDNAFLSMMNERQGRESRARGSGLNQPFTHNGTRKDTFVVFLKYRARQRCMHVINSVYKRRAQGGESLIPPLSFCKSSLYGGSTNHDICFY